jgi:hypothetical protein
MMIPSSVRSVERLAIYRKIVGIAMERIYLEEASEDSEEQREAVEEDNHVEMIRNLWK